MTYLNLYAQALILILVLIFRLPSAHSQVLSTEEIIELSTCENFTCTSEKLVNKGFSYLWRQVENGTIYYTFNSDKNFPTDSSPQITTPNTVTVMRNPEFNFTIASFRTSKKYLYQKMLSELQDRGFIESDSEPLENGIIVYYKSSEYSNLRLSIITDRLSRKGVGTWTSYCFNMTRNFE